MRKRDASGRSAPSSCPTRPNLLKGLCNPALSALLLAAALAGCDSGSINPEPQAGTVSGRVTYDAVPAVPTYLDYAATKQLPVRGAIVEAVSGKDENGQVVASGRTDADGGYVLELPPGSDVRIRVQARLLRDGGGKGGSWDVAVRDNTSPEFLTDPGNTPIYALQSEPLSVPAQGARLDLHAASGWNDRAYTGTRAAAPFSVLDQTYSAIQRFLDGAPDLDFPPLNVYWSIKNGPAEGKLADGDIGTSHYHNENDEDGPIGLYILGKEDVDTDEYDTAIVIHEWGHYFEKQVSRADNIGGSHALGEKVDMRVAWGEGWGNALAGVVRDDPVYIDTSGKGQSGGFTFDVSALPDADHDRSWYSEASMQYFIYQLSRIPGGFDATVSVLRNEQKRTPAFTSVFPFATALGSRLAGSPAIQADTLLDSLNIPRMAQLDPWGSAVTYTILTEPPIVSTPYSTVDEQDQELCVTNGYGAEYNKFGQGRSLRLEVPVAGTYRLNAVRSTSHPFDSHALLRMTRDGIEIDNEREDDVSFDFALEAGTHTGWLVDSALSGLDEDSESPSALTNVCYRVNFEPVTASQGAL
ncbi:hypothetical protein PIGHUM_04723 [Pigmentiphaga humi]|uniref:Uncharacterized protein n=1 Tax=Pigmentiphaga humi TaxID=2478468 RepID=A0A3P4B9G8_9BURK|nr:carboxypeptidase-like regulatory domain-containing protein [Pigmentiphaga humi]VCU72621.1 hypothetical protein PIGHUM_04723 [Pigmentiphaga humi]